MQYVRTKFGCYGLAENFFGQHPVKIEDSEADLSVTQADLNTFQIRKIDPIPSTLWSAWIKLCFHFCQRGIHTEVSCRIMQDETGAWRILVPRQEVSGGSVRVKTFDESIDIISGEEFNFYPPEGWRGLGSSHSHNTMDAFFSGTDDQYELTDPGMHVVVGRISIDRNQYTLKASVTAAKTRFAVDDYNLLIDTTPTEQEFNPNVLSYVTEFKYTGPSSGLLAKTQLTNAALRSGDDSLYQEWQRKVYGTGYTESSYQPARWQVEDKINDFLAFLNNIDASTLTQSAVEDLLDISSHADCIVEEVMQFTDAGDAPASSSAALIPAAEWDEADELPLFLSL